MDFSKFFRADGMKEAKVEKIEWGGTGAMPAIGKEPAYPALPKIQMPSNISKITEPSAEALKAAKSVLQFKA